MIYTDYTLKPIYQGQAYTSPDGRRYPSTFPLSEIAGLYLVNEVAAPTDPALVILGFTIDNTFTQVWDARAKTSLELTTENNNNIKSQIRTLEAITQTPRYMREAIIDPTNIKELDAQIAALRVQLSEV